MLGRHLYPSQLVEQLVAFLEADHGSDPPNHAQYPR